jgi:hypothetical protein
VAAWSIGGSCTVGRIRGADACDTEGVGGVYQVLESLGLVLVVEVLRIRLGFKVVAATT